MRIFLVFYALLFATAFGAAARTTNELLDELTRALDNKDAYFKQRADRIATLTRQFHARRADDAARFAVGLRIYQEYKSFKYDSAFAYSQRRLRLATSLKSPEKIELSKLNLAFINVSSGMFKEAFDVLESV